MIITCGKLPKFAPYLSPDPRPFRLLTQYDIPLWTEKWLKGLLLEPPAEARA
jgi:hypothetical protein